MKKIYMAPAVEINETLANSMLALSVPMADGTDGDEADVKVGNDWSIWDEE